MAHHAPPRHDAAYFRDLDFRADPLRGRHAEILECWFEKRPIRTEYLIVDGGKLAGAGAHSYSTGDATKGSQEAAKFGATR